MSKEEFQRWFKSGSTLPLAVKGHTFSLGRDDIVKVDGGKFVYEEALQLVIMLNSRNPLSQLNASVLIWERNGVLRLIVLALAGGIVVLAIALARRSQLPLQRYRSVGKPCDAPPALGEPHRHTAPAP